MATNIINTDPNKIPIYYRYPAGSGYPLGTEVITGYLSKKKYTGANPPYFNGHFKCEECNYKWISATRQGCQQSCYSCFNPNWPYKVYHLEDRYDDDLSPHTSDFNEDQYSYDGSDDDEYYDTPIIDEYYDTHIIVDYVVKKKPMEIFVTENDKIPIYYRIPEEFGCKGKELITGYLEKKKFIGGRGKRLFGHFECQDCGNTWTSANTWQGYKQQCRECDYANWPFKVYHLEQSGDTDNRKPHITELCEKCQELGRNCRDDDVDGSGRIPYNQYNHFYDKGFKKQFELFRFGIELEPKFIIEFYVIVLPLLDDIVYYIQFTNALKYTIKDWEKKGNKDMVKACIEVFEKQFELIKFDNIVEPKLINQHYELLWPYLNATKKAQFKEELVVIKKKWETHNNKKMVKACRNVLIKI